MRGEEMFDEMMEELETEFQQTRNRVDQDDLDDQKQEAEEGSLALTQASNRQDTGMRLPTVKPPNASRKGRKMAAAEQERQWSMVQTTQRTVIATNSMVGAAIHAQRQLDLAQEFMADRFYGVKRRAAMNEFMGQVTSKCLSLAESGVMAILESHPKRIAEDL
jgi:hypothetical protein